MKNIILITVLLILTSFAFGQKKEKEKERVNGVKFGYHKSTITNNGADIDFIDPLNTFYIGVSRVNKIVPMIAIVTEFEYFKNGYENNVNNSNLNANLHTLSLPVSLRFKFGPVFVLGGISANFIVSQKYELNGEKQSVSSEQKAKTFDAPFHIGLGLKVLFFTFEARYNLGLIDLRENEGYRANYFQLGASISL